LLNKITIQKKIESGQLLTDRSVEPITASRCACWWFRNFVPVWCSRPSFSPSLRLERRRHFSPRAPLEAALTGGFFLFIWLKSPEAISADIVHFPPAKSVVFAGCACATRWGRFQRTSFISRRQKAWFLPAAPGQHVGGDFTSGHRAGTQVWP
jgi:hypothetical protein